MNEKPNRKRPSLIRHTRNSLSMELRAWKGLIRAEWKWILTALVVLLALAIFSRPLPPSDIYLADEGGVQVDMSREASLETNDAPTHDSDTPTAVSLVSMFQTNSVAFRCERFINWQRRRASAVAILTGATWGAPVEG